MRFLAFVMAVVVLASACVGPEGSTRTASTLPSATAPTSPSIAAPTASPGPSALPTSAVGDPCPGDGPISVAEYVASVEADPSCFADGDVTVFGWVGPWPEGIGWLAPGIDPGWLALSTAAIWPGQCAGSSQGCGDGFSVHIDPDSGLEWKADGRWVAITGHTHDPQAETCHSVAPGGIPADEARDQCRKAFVLTSVRRASDALTVNSFARVVIPELNVRGAPSTSAPVLQEGHADAVPTKIRYGTTSGIDDVYVLDGPVKADGYRWWQVLRTEYVPDTDPARGGPIIVPDPFPDTASVGWVADGEAGHAWLIPAENPCPEVPIETSDVTLKVASWAIGLGCFQSQTLTFRGWNAGGNSIFPVKRTWEDPDNHDRLDFLVFPSTLALPPPGQWFEVTGRYDHPSSATCVEREVLACRMAFTATEIVPLGP